MSKKRWNLLAAVLCTVASTLACYAAYLDLHNAIGTIVFASCVLATLGGLAWIVAAL